jgi:hypothetical protein
VRGGHCITPDRRWASVVELAVLADEHGFDRRLHVVVDAARAGSFEEREGAIVGVEHHFLGLARIGPHADPLKTLA